MAERPEAPPVETTTAPRSTELVHLPPVADAGPTPPEPDPDRLGDVDEWGRSERMRAVARALYDPMYRHWFRAEWEHLDRIPTEGGALLVANHAGAVPPDAPVIMHGIETELDRPVYGLADHMFRDIPVVGTLWSRMGGVVAHPDNAYRLLHDQGQLVLVFPEGIKGPGKHVSERYRLRRFGRGGFVEIAMRAGVPIVPIAVVGAEESMPVLAKSTTVARAMGLPYIPFTVGYLPAKFRLRVLEPVRLDVEPGLDRYSRSRIMDESEAIRGRIQEELHDMLRRRRSIWFG
ncbi:lysophospholipid acyltransferase family protein [Actinomarinicola tropica]|uniref:Glycerol acyltransferase n=1 Tax=Actinomarinicola tropica TaxID=2789776 RepID=A0A5Q2RKF7_9ACTN|nr:lysophospholipid acyltransferase family protein [Actinomarinicola tropica]QGG95964.1 glycerol acyltransferase [Actinomarinicola tropica]